MKTIKIKQASIIFCFLILTSTTTVKSQLLNPIRNLIAPPETETATSVTVLWDKPEEYKDITGYDVYVNNKRIAVSKITNFTINNLNPNTTYLVSIVAKNLIGWSSVQSKLLRVKTKSSGKVFNILKFGAVSNHGTLNTNAIQKAINACSSGGIVYIPEGTFESGALFLKSDMTLYIAKGGVLKGSDNVVDYLPLIETRFEGWELKTYASLLTAGKLDASGKSNLKNLSIRGEGKIQGAGSPLGNAMIEKQGMRGRGRLICVMNCENVNIDGLTIENSPCWSIHYTYSKNVSCHGLNIISTALNGDGIDPDSSLNSYIFNCTFSNSDDCIAIKSGKIRREIK